MFTFLWGSSVCLTSYSPHRGPASGGGNAPPLGKMEPLVPLGPERARRNDLCHSHFPQRGPQKFGFVSLPGSKRARPRSGPLGRSVSQETDHKFSTALHTPRGPKAQKRKWLKTIRAKPWRGPKCRRFRHLGSIRHRLPPWRFRSAS